MVSTSEPRSWNPNARLLSFRATLNPYFLNPASMPAAHCADCGAVYARIATLWAPICEAMYGGENCGHVKQR